jgi:cyanophycinase
MGYLMLQGGAEFGGQMRASDLRAIELAGGPHMPVCIIPAAAAPDENHVNAGKNGRDWFRALGARKVSVTMLIDHVSANDPKIADQLQQAKLLYLPGGFPVYLAQVLKDSLGWQAMQTALGKGAVLAGSSAGAMVMCEYLFDPRTERPVKGLGFLSNCCVLPHHKTFGRQWASRLQKDLPRATLIGIDEETGMINDGPGGQWSVYGQGAVTIYQEGHQAQYAAGTMFKLKCEST